MVRAFRGLILIPARLTQKRLYLGKRNLKFAGLFPVACGGDAAIFQQTQCRTLADMTEFAELPFADMAGATPGHLPDIALSLHNIHPPGQLSTADESQHAQNISGKFQPVERSQCCFGIETSSLLLLSFLPKNIQNHIQRAGGVKPLKNHGFNVSYLLLSSGCSAKFLSRANGMADGLFFCLWRYRPWRNANTAKPGLEIVPGLCYDKCAA